MDRSQPIHLCVMLSGGGRTLLNILDHIEAGRLDARVDLVIASRACAGAERARRHGIETHEMHGDVPAAVLGAMLRARHIDYVVLAGYLRRVNIPLGYEARFVNIHPALLPKFGGQGMYGERVHAAVLAAGDRESGCTVHFCDEQYDHGPIILQERCPVMPGDTPETLAARVFEIECAAYPRALQLLARGRVEIRDGRVHIAPAPDESSLAAPAP